MIARVEAGSPDGDMSAVDVTAAVRDVADLYEPVAEAEGAELVVETPEPITIRASRELLGQAIANLVDNAIKYGGNGRADGRRVVVSTARENGTAILRVADNGPGIPAEERERVLQRFVRLEKSRSQPGSGLGLSLVAAVVRLHDGTIELGDGGPGLVVTIRLPVR
jgi:signal transduction histidine kinase